MDALLLEFKRSRFDAESAFAVFELNPGQHYTEPTKELRATLRVTAFGALHTVPFNSSEATAAGTRRDLSVKLLPVSTKPNAPPLRPGVGIVAAVLLIIAFWPMRHLAAPRWSVVVVTDDGQPLANINVRLVYQNYSAEEVKASYSGQGVDAPIRNNFQLSTANDARYQTINLGFRKTGLRRQLFALSSRSTIHRDLSRR